MDQYDYLIVNDSLEKSVDQVHNIIQAEHYKVDRNSSTIKEMQKELKMFERSN
jgi:guanylate kinase